MIICCYRVLWLWLMTYLRSLLVEYIPRAHALIHRTTRQSHRGRQDLNLSRSIIKPVTFRCTSITDVSLKMVDVDMFSNRIIWSVSPETNPHLLYALPSIYCQRSSCPNQVEPRKVKLLILMLLSISVGPDLEIASKIAQELSTTTVSILYGIR